ncbi:MAG: DUF2807 domain-containing protein [Bacteroidota bacterium]
MKQSYILLTILLFAISLLQAQERSISTEAFDKVVVNPSIDVTLAEGETENVQIQESNVPLADIQIEVKNKTLKIYLESEDPSKEQKKSGDWFSKLDYADYENAVVKVLVTYKKLSKLSIRGEQEVALASPIASNKLKIKLFGASNVIVEKLEVQQLKVALFGENHFEVKNGYAAEQSYRTFGENQVDVRRLNNQYARLRTFGENEFKVEADERIRLSGAGESKLMYSGQAELTKGIALGEHQIRRVK